MQNLFVEMIEFHTNFVERREHSVVVPRDVPTYLRRKLLYNSDAFPIVRSPLNITMRYSLRLSRFSSVMFSQDAFPKFPLQEIRNTNLKNE